MITPPPLDLDSMSNELAVSVAACDSQPAPTVGIAGVGGVASYAHVPAYRDLGFAVRVLYDTDADALDICRRALGAGHRLIAATTDIGRLCDHLVGLDFLDVALPTPAHATFIHSLFDQLGTDCPALLVQKPLSDINQAEEIVDRAGHLGVRIGINLTGRWVPTFALLHDMIQEGAAGDNSTIAVLNRGWNPKNGIDWRSQLARLITFEMAVHYIDLLVWTYGVPRTVYAAMQHVPGQGVRGENVAFVTFVFDSGVKASVIQDWTCRTTAASHFHPTQEQITVSGSKATIVATPHELQITDGQQTRTFSSSALWFPDAFAGPAAEFAQALRQDRPSPLDAVNHLPVLRVIEACYTSARTNAVVEVIS